MDTTFEHIGNTLANATDEQMQKVLLQYMKKTSKNKEDLLKYFSEIINCDSFYHDGSMKKERMVEVDNMKHLHSLIQNRDIKGCGHCKSTFEEDDFAYALETGTCQYCHSVLEELLLDNWTYETGVEDLNIMGSGSTYSNVYKSKNKDDVFRKAKEGGRNYIKRFKKVDEMKIVQEWNEDSKTWIE